MRSIDNWPAVYSKELLIGDLNKSVGVCTLWSDREHIAGEVGIENAAVFGNLYSHGPGPEGVIRNILANPRIRTIVMAGKDKSRSGDTLKTFFQAGVEESRHGWVIPLPEGINENDLQPGQRMIDKAIPLEAIKLMRKNVELIDMCERSWSEVREKIQIQRAESAFTEPTIYPETKNAIEVLKGEEVGFVFRGVEPEKVWLEILRNLRGFGFRGESQYTSKTQEVLNVMSVLNGSLENMMRWPGWVGHSPEAVCKYSEQLIKGVAVDADDSYAYGERMRVRNGDQLQSVIEGLRQSPHSRGYVVSLWNVREDLLERPKNPPCMTQVWFRYYQDRLSATFTYRSHDMYGAWIKSAMGDRLLQAHVAEQVNLPLGHTTIISQSAHIYEHDFAQIDALLANHSARWEFVEDPRGNFVINIDDGEIVARHENRSGAVTVIRGKKAEGVYKKIWGAGLVSKVDHALYIGSELAKAESNLRNDREYIQDRA